MAFHHVREGSALDEWRIIYINTHENIADLLTKNLSSGAKRTKFCKMLLHFLTPSIDVGEEADQQATVAAVKVLPGRWIEAILWVFDVWETEQAAA